MKMYIKVLLLFVFSISLLQLNAQVKKSKKPVKEEEVQEPPPEEMKISVMGTADRAGSKSESDPPLQILNFDTTAAPADEFSNDIREMLRVTNALDLGRMFAAGMADTVNQNETIRELYRRLMADFREGMLARWMENGIIKLYRETYTHEEIREVIKFYNTPVGKKVIAKTPNMMQASMDMGRRMGEYRALQLLQEMEGTRN